MKEKNITKGIIIPLYLLHMNLTKNEILIFNILNSFNKTKFVTEKDIKNPKLKDYTINLSKTNLNKLIPLSKNTIKLGLNSLNNKNFITILDDTYFNIKLKTRFLDKFKYKTKGFIFIPIEILYNKDLNINDKIILSYIKGFKDSNEPFNFSNNHLIKILNISKHSLINSLEKLKKLGFIENKINNSSHVRTININQLNIENYFENADIREIREANIREVKEANINSIKTVKNINSVQNLTINLGLNDLKAFNKADLLSIKKALNNELTKLINNKQ